VSGAGRIHTVAVVGAGTMGSGIAQTCALSELEVLLYDAQEGAPARALEAMKASLTRLVKKGTLTEGEVQAALSRVRRVGDLSDLAGADAVIEAVVEALEVKREVWGQLAAVVPEDALLASNTSSLSVTEIAAAVGHPERFCGLHFFNPVPVLPLVEVVRAQQTTAETLGRAQAFVEKIGKTPILCDDKPGFIVNRLLIPYLSDAVFALSEGVGSASDIDTAMKLGANMPIGPLALLDLIGLDVALAAAESLHAEFQDPKFRVPPLLRRLVRAGKLGRKSGEGFYTYEENA
jgi:3-hydroxybutyryl-CoA dehydrogenase